MAIGNEIEFTLENLGYQFPRFPVPEGETMDSFLAKVVWEGARQRYEKINERVRSQIEHELGLIRRVGIFGVFPDRLGSGPILPGIRHHDSRPWQCGQ